MAETELKQKTERRAFTIAEAAPERFSLEMGKTRSATDMYVTVERLRLGREVLSRFPDLRERKSEVG